MMRHQLAAVIMGSAALVGCTAPASTAGPAQRAEARTTEDTESVKVNIDEIFPDGQGRDLVLNNCTSCHTFVPIVVLQMDQEAWAGNRLIHRERVSALSDAEFETVYQYLVANFNPDRPVPKLPKALLNTWTGY